MVHAPRAKRAFAPTLALAAAGWLVAASAGVVALTARVVDSPPILVNNFGLGEATIVAFVVHGLAFASVGAERYDAQRTAEALTLRLRGEIDLDAARKELVRSVEHTVVPSHVTAWVRTRARP